MLNSETTDQPTTTANDTTAATPTTALTDTNDTTAATPTAALTDTNDTTAATPTTALADDTALADTTDTTTTTALAQTSDKQIEAAVLEWPGVTAGFGSRGEYAFTLGRREIGHLHGDRVLHAAWPKAIWQELYDAGRIDYHPVFPGKPGYGARQLRSQEDVLDAIALLRINYDREVTAHGLPGARG